MCFQTFNLARRFGLLIKRALLDRFLACMKPASMTERRPCAGVFFGPFVFRKIGPRGMFYLQMQHVC